MVSELLWTNWAENWQRWYNIRWILLNLLTSLSLPSPLICDHTWITSPLRDKFEGGGKFTDSIVQQYPTYTYTIHIIFINIPYIRWEIMLCISQNVNHATNFYTPPFLFSLYVGEISWESTSIGSFTFFCTMILRYFLISHLVF